MQTRLMMTAGINMAGQVMMVAGEIIVAGPRMQLAHLARGVGILTWLLLTSTQLHGVGCMPMLLPRRRRPLADSSGS